MNIKDFVSNYTNHPVLFIGTGMSLRYLKNSYTWDDLLKKIAIDLTGDTRYYLDLKYDCKDGKKYKYNKIASNLEENFNKILKSDKPENFNHINDIFYENMKNGISLSRFKIYISSLLKGLEFKEDMLEELDELKKVRKNIGSIITTNYDTLIEEIFDFKPLIGNDILLSNPYGALYKIHGCITNPDKIIITENDYIEFNKKYELIRAQLLSLFMHNPIIFIGYNLDDDNIKNLLKTIFTYIEPNSVEAEKIRGNFLLVEYEKDSTNTEISEYDIDTEDFGRIRINKIKTDNYIAIYKELSEIHLPVSAMDIRKVQNIMHEIQIGGKIKVAITEDVDSLGNEDKILVIGTEKSINFKYMKSGELINNYFTIIEESNTQIISLIDIFTIPKTQYFPIFGFDRITNNLETASKLKKQQKANLQKFKQNINQVCKTAYTSIEEINSATEIAPSNKISAIIWSVLEDKISLESLEIYLKSQEDKNNTDYRKLLCAYDFKKYSST